LEEWVNSPDRRGWIGVDVVGELGVDGGIGCGGLSSFSAFVLVFLLLPEQGEYSYDGEEGSRLDPDW